MTAPVVLFVLLLLVACLAGFLQDTFGKGPRAGSRPADDPAGVRLAAAGPGGAVAGDGARGRVAGAPRPVPRFISSVS
ncbi:hypothetical protein Kisp01_70300 [Kineosporia sp. NBRC 101677]|nr:hypothetical protein Kisp01_70300 [Kineosporia sp. NBRC 101677]